MVEANQTNEDHIWIFCFGSNGPKQLSERLGSDYKDLMTRTLAAEAKGWLRGYKATAVTWGGKSVATIWKTGKDEDSVLGTVVKMTKAEVEALDPYEAYPFKYDRIKLTLNAFKAESEGEAPKPFELECQAYAIIDKEKYNVFVDPSDEYKLACCKTIYTARTLLGRGAERDIDLKVYNAVTKTIDNEFKYTITDKDVEKM